VGKQRPAAMAFAGLGLLNAVLLAAGLAGGWLVDRALGTRPLFLLIGMVTGVVLGALAIRSEWKRYF
jgi:F0F1-type ATP synthase assembly protein I